MAYMEFPAAVRAAAEREALQQPLRQLQARANALSERYRGEHKNGERLLSEAIDAAVYAVTRMPATYGAIAGALRGSALPQQPRTMLDVGAGTGAGALAAGAIFPLSKIFCVEREPAMRSLGAKLLAESELPAVRNVEFVPGDLTRGGLKLHADLVLAAYVLNEVAENRRDEALEQLWNAAVQTLVLVEPGTPEGFRLLRRAEQTLKRLGGHTAAPCTGGAACPLPKEDWCHFSARIQRGKLHRTLKGGDVPYEDEKYCYLTVTRYVPEPAELRVLRHPQAAPGRIGLTLCTAQGILEQTVSKKSGAAFRTARKAEWGDSLTREQLAGKETE